MLVYLYLNHFQLLLDMRKMVASKVVCFLLAYIAKEHTYFHLVLVHHHYLVDMNNQMLFLVVLFFVFLAPAFAQIKIGGN